MTLIKSRLTISRHDQDMGADVAIAPDDDGRIHYICSSCDVMRDAS